MLHRIELVTGCDKKAPNVTEKKRESKMENQILALCFSYQCKGKLQLCNIRQNCC